MDDPKSHPGGADGRWRVELLGTCAASSGSTRITRFPSRAVALLLARMAIRPRSAHAREELIELLWPGVDLATGRNRLRPTLSVLRHLLSPDGSHAGELLQADRLTIRLNAEVLSCDAVDFEDAVRQGRVADARALYRGELLPGHYANWVLDERRRLQDLFDGLADNPSSFTPAIARPVPASDDVPHALPSLVDSASDSPTVHAPSYLSLFIGRDAELAQCAGLVAAHRLVTLTGIGGCGKTRLAIELARAPTELSARFDTIVFVELADCRDAAQLADRLRIAARLPGGTADALDTLRAQFGDRRVLVILDNFEQLVDADGPRAVTALLECLPAVHALVTSRRALQLAGEHEMCLMPFGVPALDDDLHLACATPAVALFLDRARSVRADFHLTPGNREDVLAICGLLDGLPLALEIAASRVRTYAPREMRHELGTGYGLVTRSMVPVARQHRHASLHAAIAWSWRLLVPEAQRFLAALTVFSGGFDAADASAVAGAPQPHDPLDVLVRDSLLAVVPADDTSDPAIELRFHMLESVRDFARAQLDATESAATRRAHRCHFLKRAKEVASAHETVPEEWLGNYIEALRTGLDDGDAEAALALMIALKGQWESVGTPPMVLDLMQRAADSVDESTPGYSTFLSMFAILLLVNGRAVAALECGVQALNAAGADPQRRAEALFAHSRVDWVLKREAARVADPAREAVRLARLSGAGATEASAMSLLGAITLWGLNDAVAAAALYQQAEALYTALGNSRGALQTWHGQMGCLFQTGRFEDTIELGRRLERRAAELRNVEAQLVALDMSVESLARLRRFDEALSAAQRETRLAQRHHRTYNLTYAVWNQGRCLARLRRPEEAGVLMGFAERYWQEKIGPLGPGQVRELAVVKRLVRAQVGAPRTDAAWMLGRALTVPEALDRARGS